MNYQEPLPPLFYVIAAVFLLSGWYLLRKHPQFLKLVMYTLAAVPCLAFVFFGWRMIALDREITRDGVSVEAMLVESYGQSGKYEFEVPGSGTFVSISPFKPNEKRWSTPGMEPPKRLKAVYLTRNPNINRPENQTVNKDPYAMILLGGFFLVIVVIQFVGAVRHPVHAET